VVLSWGKKPPKSKAEFPWGELGDLRLEEPPNLKGRKGKNRTTKKIKSFFQLPPKGQGEQPGGSQQDFHLQPCQIKKNTGKNSDSKKNPSEKR